MKSFLAIALATLSLSSFAGVLGHPDQDPVVRATAQLFDDGELPTAGFLINNKFSCVMMSAEKGNFAKDAQDEVSFKRSGKMFVSEDLADDLFFIVTENNEMVATGIMNDEAKFAALRMNYDENVLVMEISKLVSVVDMDEASKSELSSKYAQPQAEILVEESESEVAVVTEYVLCSIE